MKSKDNKKNIPIPSIFSHMLNIIISLIIWSAFIVSVIYLLISFDLL